MSVTSNTVYTKNGATFATAQDAWDNKNSLFTPHLQQSLNDCFAQMLVNGVLLEPVSAAWNQDTFELTISKVTTSVEAYDAAISFNIEQVSVGAENAGWTFVRKFIC